MKSKIFILVTSAILMSFVQLGIVALASTDFQKQKQETKSTSIVEYEEVRELAVLPTEEFPKVSAATVEAVSSDTAMAARDHSTVSDKTAAVAVRGVAAKDPITPAHIRIPAMGIQAPVKAMGLEENGKMAVPNNYTEVGWYKYGAKPGEMGSAVMGAHVDNGSTIAGVFKKLNTLKIGDDIYVSAADGATLHFKVVEKKIYDHQTKSTAEVFAQNDKPRLNLITCHGTWLKNANTYDKRLVVFAELQ